MSDALQLLIGDCRERLRELAPKSVHTCVTSPPYFGLRDYGEAAQIGMEETPEAFVEQLVEVFREVRRVLRDDGTVWLNLGDSYATQGGQQKTPHMGAMFADRVRGQSVISKGKRLPRGTGRWGGGNNPATGLLKPKDLIGIPWRVAFALQADGWYLRQDIIWAKPNPMPESVRDRCTKSHEYVFMLSKSPKYFYDAKAVAEPSIYGLDSGHSERAKGYYKGKFSEPDHTNRRNQSFKAIRETRNKRSVWTVAPKPYKEAHFATYPPDLIEPCILAGSPVGGVVLDPFGGCGTTAGVAIKHGRRAILCELNPNYAALVDARIASIAGDCWDLV